MDEIVKPVDCCGMCDCGGDKEWDVGNVVTHADKPEQNPHQLQMEFTKPQGTTLVLNVELNTK